MATSSTQTKPDPAAALAAYDEHVRSQMGQPGGEPGSCIIHLLEIVATQFAGYSRQPPSQSPTAADPAPAAASPAAGATGATGASGTTGASGASGTKSS